VRENPLVAFFVERFVFATAIFVGLVLVGLLLGLGLGVELLPRFSVPVVAVSTAYPGAGPEEVAEQVSKPLEDALSTLSGVDTIGSSSTEGFSLVFVQFQQGVNVDQAAVEVSQKVAAARGSLPKDASAPVVQKFDPSASPILYIALEAPGEDLSQVLRYAERSLKPRLQLVPGVADIRLTGAPKRAIRVYLDPSRLQALGVAPGQVVQAISASALNLPLGSLTQEEKRLVYTLRSTPATPGEVAGLLVDPSRGIRVRDVARVEERPEAPSTLNRLNGRPAVLLAVVKTPQRQRRGRGRRGHQGPRRDQAPPGLPGRGGPKLHALHQGGGERHRAGGLPSGPGRLFGGPHLPGEAQLRLLRDPGHPHHPLRGHPPLRRSRLHLQPDQPPGPHPGGGHRGGRLHRGGGEH
jgi:HAE1 family hydrophobic/amphiphilic exporter-1